MKKRSIITRYRMTSTFILFILFCFSGISNTYAQENLISNGNFESGWSGSMFDRKPVDWNVNGATIADRNENCPEGNGQTSLMAYLIGGSISQTDKSADGWRTGVIDVEEGATYHLSLWCKTNVSINLSVIFNLYQKTIDDEIYKDRLECQFKLTPNEWQKVEQDITIPIGKNINVTSFSVLFPRNYTSGGELLVDNISLTKKQSDKPDVDPKPEKPKDVDYTSYQREITLTWAATEDKDISYEILANEKTYFDIKDNTFTIEDLSPYHMYEVQVFAVKNGVKSDKESLNILTKNYEKPKDSDERIPYLYTIKRDGSCRGRFLKLYYNDLANPNAIITYKLDGKPITPKNRVLEFPAFEGYYKRFMLEIHIDEGNDYEWDIIYNELSVQNF